MAQVLRDVLHLHTSPALSAHARNARGGERRRGQVSAQREVCARARTRPQQLLDGLAQKRRRVMQRKRRL